MRIPSAFSFNLGNPVEAGLVTVGRYDGKHLSLTCGTTGGKVLIHNPHEPSPEGVDMASSSNATPHVRFLNINKQITALKAGSLGGPGEADILFVATQTNLMAYDVEKNHDVFYKDVQDGVGAIVVGKGLPSEEPLAYVGGNCSIQGFDKGGRETFWTVTGDKVAALALCDVDGDGNLELMAGSDDFEVRAFKQEEAILEITEADQITHLCPIGGSSGSGSSGGGSGGPKATARWAYGLANGTVGLYERSKRIWRVRTKHKVTALAAFDIDGDGEEELICGLDSGGVVARKLLTGAVVYKDSFSSPVAGIVLADYRNIGREELLVVACDGEVRGYEPKQVTAVAAAAAGSGAGGVHLQPASSADDSRTIDALQRRKQELSMELRSLEEAAKARKAGGRPPGTIPANTRLSVRTIADLTNGTLELLLGTNNDTSISAAVASDPEGRMFGGETLVATALSPTPQLALRLPTGKHQAGVLKIQAFVGPRGSPAGLYILHSEYAVPKFATFVHAENGGGGGSGGKSHRDQRDSEEPAAGPQPSGSVSFSVPEQQSRVAMWVGQSFTSPPSGFGDSRNNGAAAAASANNADVSWKFLSVVPGPNGLPEPLWIECRRGGGGTAVRVCCDDIGLAGEVVQDLSKFLQVQELESIADFPQEMARFGDTLQRVTDHDSLRLRLAADTADYLQRVKALVVRAEDCRLLGDYPLMRHTYAELMALNRQLMSEHAKRANNQTALLEALKEVNSMIQKAASLRMGKAKARVVADCRAALRDHNTPALLQVAAQGHDPHARAGDEGPITVK